MINKDKDSDLLEKYIDGELSGETLELFEERLKVDQELANEYAIRLKLAKIWLEAEDYQTTKDEISGIINSDKPSFFISNIRYIISIAATIIIFIGAYLLFFQSNNDLNNNQQLVLSDTADNSDDSISFKIDEPEKLAEIEYLKDSIELLFPINNITFTSDSPIVFKWKSLTIGVDTLFIFSISDGQLVRKQVVQPSEEFGTLEVGILSPGAYEWHFNDTTTKASFIISNNN